MKFVPAVASLFCLTLPGSFSERVVHPFVLQCDNSHSRSELTFLSSPLWSDDHDAGGRGGDINLTVHYAAPLQNSLSPFPFPLTALQNGGDRGGSAHRAGNEERNASHVLLRDLEYFCTSPYMSVKAKTRCSNRRGKKGWIGMKEQKATLIPIVQQIRLNSQNELVKRTTKGDSVADGQAQNPSGRLA